MALGAPTPDRARDDVARRQFRPGDVRHKALAGLVDENGAFAAHGFADERHRPRRAVERGRVELHEFEIGEFGAGARGEREALAETAVWVGAVLVKPADAAGGDDDFVRRQRERPLPARRREGRAPLRLRRRACAPQILRARVWRACGGRRRRARASVRAPCRRRRRGRCAGARCAASSPSAKPPAPTRSNATPRRASSSIACGAARVKRFDDPRRAEPVARGERVGRVQRRAVVGAERCGEAALRPQSRAFGAQRRLGDEDDRARREAKRRHQAGDPGADDRDAAVESAQIGAHSAIILSTARRARSAIAGSMVTS